MRPDGLRAAAQALRYWQDRQQVVAHNLANADTPGFKAERVFARLIGDRMVAAETATDLSPGSLTKTDSPLDLALEGAGFFVVGTAAGERLTRGGPMHVDAAGRIVDAAGDPLLGVHGPLVVPPGRVEVDGAGVVRVEGERIGRLRVETTPADVRLEREAGGRYLPPAGRAALPPEERAVRQGYIEESNVSPIESLVEMITVQRSFAAVEKSVRVIDGVLATVANEIGKVS